MKQHNNANMTMCHNEIIVAQFLIVDKADNNL